MRIVEPNAVMMKHDMHPYRFIEKVARVCYKSEDKISENSDLDMIENLKHRKHFAMFEHEYVYFKFSLISMLNIMIDNTVALVGDPSIIKYINVCDRFMSCSFRAIIDIFEKLNGYNEEDLLDEWLVIYDKLHDAYPEVFDNENLLNLLGNYTEEMYNSIELLDRDKFLEKTSYYGLPTSDIQFKCLPYTIHFTCDRGVSHELVRHRPCSFAQESTRYCNYNLGKFGSEITVIKPLFYKEGATKFNIWKEACEQAERSYLALIELGSAAQEARSVLPNSLKTEIVVTATAEEWQHIVNLRYWGKTGKPHPQMLEIMNIAYELLTKANGDIE